MNGFYAGYFTATSGVGLAMFILREGVIIGSDPSGVIFDGTFVANGDGSADGLVAVSAPPGVTLIQGITVGPEGLKYTLPIHLPPDVSNAPFIRLDTPIGAVNLRLVKLKEI